MVLEQEDGRFRLVREGSPFVIKGVGGTIRLAELKARGGNAIRTWDAEGIAPLMDEAHELGLGVMVGIWLEHQRHGYDHSDPEQRRKEIERVERLVKELRHHPALLGWGVGNELELGGDLDIALEQTQAAAAAIKRLDTDHPTMAVLTEIGDDKAIRVQRECPDIDILGINTYGGAVNLAERLEQQGFTGAFAVTEFGPLGHWETGATPWGAPFEQTSTEKAEFLRQNYEHTIVENLGTNCVGSFAFLWGHKQEKTATWFGMMLPTGETLAAVDVLQEMWTGSTPENRAPRVGPLSMPGVEGLTLEPGQRVRFQLEVSDPDGDPVEVSWRVKPESTDESMGGDFEQTLDPIELDIRKVGAAESVGASAAEITMPVEEGAYRVFVTVRDGQGHAGTANLPVFVGDPR
ncbi:MAG: glycoside hydrolase family 2 TIM barrel-domain containing protein [Planctomycetota bacterium]